MKTVGSLGGMSWESTQTYYQLLNQGVKQQLGGLHSAKVILHSVNFAEVAALQHDNDWDALTQLLQKAAQGLEQAGAESIVICTNTMHKIAPEVEQALSVPLLHIVDATAKVLMQKQQTKVGLLGTRFTMEDDFFVKRLQDKFGIEAIVPNEQDRQIVHEVIYQELCQGECKASSRDQYIRIVDELAQQGAQGIILGCTEIGLLLKPEHTTIPLFDTAQLHAQAIVDWMFRT